MNPPRRVPVWGWITLAAGCGLLLLCLCIVVVAGGWFIMQRPAIGIAPGPAPLPPVNRIAYQGSDGNIYTVAPDGSDPRQLTDDGQTGATASRLNRTPTWAPDGRHVAYVKVSVGGGGLQSSLHAVALETGASETLHNTTGAGPFYLHWAPDSRQLAFLESAGQTIALRLAQLGLTEARELERGSPYYFHWSPDSQNLLMHVDGIRRSSPSARISLLNLQQGSQPAQLSDNPSVFLAPDWSPDGKTLLYARKGDSGDELVLAEADGANPRQLFSFNGSLSFAWSPRGDAVAYINTESPAAQGLGQLAFGRLAVTDLAGADRRTLSQERTMAFFWSPDGSKIAYLTITNAPNPNELLLRWNIADIATGESRPLAAFSPTEEFISIIPFFDQYARSLRVWSPDSRSLVYAVEDSSDTYGIYVLDIEAGDQPRRIADGVTAGWSWR